MRPMAFTHEPWKLITIRARTPRHADTILRREGYEVLTGSIQRADTARQLLAPARPKPVLCNKCGYALDGLTIESAHIQCPECAFNQVIVSWSPEVETVSKTFVWIGLFAAFGLVILIVVMLVMLFILTY